MKKIVSILMIIMLISSVAFAEGTEVEMEQHIVTWGIAEDYNRTTGDIPFKNFEESISLIDKDFGYHTKIGVGVSIPKDFFIGQAGYMQIDHMLKRNVDNDVSFLRIKSENEDLEIKSITRLFVMKEAETIAVNDSVTFSKIYALEEELKLENNIMEYIGTYEEIMEGHFLIVPNKIGEYSLTIEVGSGEEVIDSKEITFEVKESIGKKYSYEVEATVSGKITRGINNREKSHAENKSVPVKNGAEIGKIDGEFYFIFNNKGNVTSTIEGKIDVLDSDGLFIVDENGYMVYNEITMNDPMEKAEVEVIGVIPPSSPKDKYTLTFGGRLQPIIKFNNTQKDNPPVVPNDNPTDTPIDIPKDTPTKKILLTILASTSLLPPLLFFTRRKVSILENSIEGYRYLAFKGGLKKKIPVDILLVEKGKETLLETIVVAKGQEIKLEGLEDKHIRIKTRIKKEKGYKNYSNYSKYTELDKRGD